MMKTKRALNMKHLRYFAEVARRGSVSRAANVLYVSPQTVSGQIQELEASIGQALFERVGRRLVLTPAGATALDYASAIFAQADELAAVLRGGAKPKRIVLRVGVTDSVPKMLTVATLEPLIARHRSQLELSCHEGPYTELLARTVAGQLDLVLADTAVPSNLSRSLQSILLADSGMSFLAASAVVSRLSGRFPHNLDGAPFLAGAVSTTLLTQSLDAWFARNNVRPHVVGRFEDSAMMNGFAHSGLGIAAVPTSIEEEVAKQYQLKVLGRAKDVRQSLFLIRARVRRAHPLVTELEAHRVES